ASEPHVQDLARMLVAMGAPIDGIGSNVITVHGTGSLRGCTHTIAPDHIEIGSFMALAGVTGGELIVKDSVPEDLRMIRLVCDPHRAIVLGPRRLTGQRVESPDIRAGMAMLIAALCADGVTEIGNIRQIDRGYERIDERLRDLGARIERVDDVPVTA